MEGSGETFGRLDARIAQRLKTLRGERGWSLDELAALSGVSRATLSRLENAEVSGTAATLGRLCSTYGIAMSRLMYLAEEDYPPVLPRTAQAVWTDPENGYRRRAVSPPAGALAGEVIEAELAPATRIAYPGASRPGHEHHLVMLDGRLTVTVDGRAHALGPGDCLRYRLFGPSAFETPAGSGAHYLLFML
ncbi:MAG: helix-turn-helix transcriptional regulator [Rhizobiaceae bacterium]|nr:helix-turn-helix transcriptional regulator [Rhizobiaceae bacterium]